MSVSFQWFPGLSVSQKQKSVDSLHAAARDLDGVDKLLEVSSKSREELGVGLSAFSLTLPMDARETAISVECAFQGSKIFEAGGPYADLYDVLPWEAKKDGRLRASGGLRAFSLLGDRWELEPKTAFYDWLYLRALQSNPDKAERLLSYSAFTDMEFNPGRSINCQPIPPHCMQAAETRLV